MHLGIVGGVERNQRHYEAAADAAGHSVECHGGHLAGTGHGSLENLIVRSDVVVIVTEVNSHAAVWAARELAKLHRRPILLVRKFGLARLREVLGSLSGGGFPSPAGAPASPH